jgi:hypothetical protein
MVGQIAVFTANSRQKAAISPDSPVGLANCLHDTDPGGKVW